MAVLLGVCACIILLLLWRDGLFAKKSLAFVLVCGALTLTAIVARAALLDSRSGDYNSFLQHWVEFYRNNGGFRAISAPIGDYNLPYLYFMALFSYIPMYDLYLIKLLSIVFDIVLAFYAMRLCGLLTDNPLRKLAVYFGVLLLPTVVINSAWWAQCDSIYAAFAVGALYYALRRRGVMSVLFAALSFSFKLQAVFILPVYAILLMTKHVKFRHLLLFPAFFVALALPSVAMGRPLVDAVLIYVNQTKTYSSYLTLNAPSIYSFFLNTQSTELLSSFGIIAAFVFIGLAYGFAWVKRRKLDNSTLVMLTCALTIGIPFLLPSMHERYFYIAEVLAVVCVAGGAAHLLLPLLVQASALICYAAYMRGRVLIPLYLAGGLMMSGLLLCSVNIAKLAPILLPKLHRNTSTTKGK